jgi:hypothetical protein
MVLNLTKNSFIEGYQEWSQILKKFNWYSFTLIDICFENETWLGGIEFTFIILGVGIRFRWNYKPEILDKMVEEAEKEINEKIKQKTY